MKQAPAASEPGFLKLVDFYFAYLLIIPHHGLTKCIKSHRFMIARGLLAR